MNNTRYLRITIHDNDFTQSLIFIGHLLQQIFEFENKYPTEEDFPLLKKMVKHLWYGADNIMFKMRFKEHYSETPIDIFECDLEFVEYLNITGEDRAITTLPMHYTFGLSVIQTHLMQGATIVLTEATIVQPEFWKLIDKHQVTTFAGVPYTYEMLKKIRFLRMKVASLRYLIQAGGKLGKELHYEMATSCAEKGIKFIVMYGQTEATARMSYVPADHAIDKAGSIGIAIPGGKFWVEDTEGNKITETGTAGELVYQGENVTMGYAQCKEDLERGYDQGDILHTGDMACFDDDGYYYIVGRKKRFLKLFGNRVNMDEVEGLLKKIGLECAVCGEDDHMKICVVGQDNKEIAEKYIDEHTSVPRFGYTVHVIEEIPRNDSGKVQYSELENMI